MLKYISDVHDIYIDKQMTISLGKGLNLSSYFTLAPWLFSILHGVYLRFLTAVVATERRD